MAQQINLRVPVLRPPVRQFSALAMSKALALVILGAFALAIFLSLQAKPIRQTAQTQLSQMAQQRQQLTLALAGLPAATDARALQQQFDNDQQQLDGQRQLLAVLKGGLGQDGQRHSDLLQLLAATVPPQVWLTELRWQAGQLELVGGALDTGVLQAWLDRLSTQTLLQGLQLAAIKVEKASPTTLAGDRDGESARVNSWNFRLRSQAPSPGGKSAAPAAVKP
jgi:Tfp pilus assembly protein PilN